MEIIHITASRWILGISRFPFLRIRDFNEVSVIFHHKVTPAKMPGCNDAPAFAINEVDLQREANVMVTQFLELRGSDSYPDLGSEGKTFRTV